MKINISDYYKLYKEYEHPPSTLFHKYISKNLAKVLTYFSLRLNLTPNFLTLLSFILIVIGVILIILDDGSSKSVVFFIIFTQLSYALDCSDGVLARIQKRSSKFGAFFDVTMDRVSLATFYMGVLWHYLYIHLSSDSFLIDLTIMLISMFIYMIYQISTTNLIFFFPELKGHMKKKNNWSFKEKIVRVMYQFIDTGIFYFIIGLSMYMNVQVYVVSFYGVLGFILTLGVFYITKSRQNENG
jgi:phosphatidylglycerophosphate synthase